MAQDRLKASPGVFEPLLEFFQTYQLNQPYFSARAVFILAQLTDPRGSAFMKPKQAVPRKWNQREQNLAWRLRSKQALEDLSESLLLQEPDLDAFRRLAYTFGLCFTEEERRRNRKLMNKFREHSGFSGEEYQIILREFLEKDIDDPDPVELDRSYLFPKKIGVPTELGKVAEIAELSPDLENGRQKSVLCMMCHENGGAGTAFGPDITNWGQVRQAEAVIHALVDPAAELAHGYDKA